MSRAWWPWTNSNHGRCEAVERRMVADAPGGPGHTSTGRRSVDARCSLPLRHEGAHVWRGVEFGVRDAPYRPRSTSAPCGAPCSDRGRKRGGTCAQPVVGGGRCHYHS